MIPWRILPILLSLGLFCHAAKERNALPVDADRALGAPEKATLYSIEPGDRILPGDDSFFAYKAWGHVELDAQQMKTVGGEFRTAVTGWNGWIAMCFNPRHALRVSAGGHVYEFVICFECNQLQVVRDGEWHSSVAASGSPDQVNAILSAAGIRLSLTDSERESEGRKRWLAAMPASLRPLWNEKTPTDEAPDVAPFRPAIIQEFPEARQRALVLFGWYTSGGGMWATVSEKLLLDIPDADLIAAALTDHPTDAQLDGAVRLFLDWDFISRHPAPLPEALKKKLWEHCRQSPSEAAFRRGQDAFGPEKAPEK